MVKKNTLFWSLDGNISDQKGEPFEGLTIKAYDHNPESGNQFLGEAVSNEKGQYLIRYLEEQIKIFDKNGDGPDIYIQIFDGDKLVGKSSVRRNAGKSITINLKIDALDVTILTKLPFSVSGTVSQSHGQPLAGACVFAFNKKLRSLQLLGETTTEKDGRYEISYGSEPELNSPQRQMPVNLMIRVQDKEENILAGPITRYNAKTQERINLTAQNPSEVGMSEFEKIEWLLSPLLGDTRLVDIKEEEEFSFLERSTQLPAERIKARIDAEKAASQTQLPTWFHYALLRHGLPGELNELLDTPPSMIRKALVQAQNEKIIDVPKSKADTELWQRFEALQADHVLNKSFQGRSLKAKQILELAGLNKKEQRSIAKVFSGKDLQFQTVSEKIKEKTDLDSETIGKIEFVVRTAALTDDHVPTMRALMKNKSVRSLRDLARDFGLAEWENLVKGSSGKDGLDLPGDVTGKTSEERRANFAGQIYQRVAIAYPTVTMAFGLLRDKKLGNKPGVKTLSKIIEADHGFNLASVRIDAYLREHGKKLGIASTKTDAVREDIKRVQRLYRLKPDLKVVSKLLQDELDSAAAILHIGKQSFLDRYGNDESLGKDIAKAVYNQAEAQAAKAFGLFTHFSPGFNTLPGPHVVGKCPAELKGNPDYASLFGTLDGCECEPCESVYSPAAYLTDLLAFIEREIRPIPPSNEPVLAELAYVPPDNGLEAIKVRKFCDANEILQEQPRRPDIPATMLSCRNADTLMPYVDLVLEILENAVAPRDTSVPQTTRQADELQAQPEHVIPKAYETLGQAIFPFDLPFDLSHEEETIFLEKLETSKAEILETFFPFVAPKDSEPDDQTEINRLRDTSIAMAYLGLTDVQWKLISEPTPAPIAPSAWGCNVVSAQTWWHPLRNANTFIERTDLQFNDMLMLWSLRSVNPEGKTKINPEDLTNCDPREIRLTGLNASALGYLHRFLRLKNSRGWSLREMDLAALSLSPPQTNNGRPKLDEGFLLRISHLIRLLNQFKLPLTELLSWWANIETIDYSVPQLPHVNFAPSLYESLFLTEMPGESEYDTFKLNASRTELKDTNQHINDHLSKIAGALRVPIPELEQLVKKLESALDRNNNEARPNLNLKNLSLIFRHASLARALGLSIKDFLTLKALIGFDPFNPLKLTAYDQIDGTLQTLRFIERTHMVQSSGFSIHEIDYILRQTEFADLSGQTIAPTDEWVTASLDTLRSSVKPFEFIITSTASLKDAIEALGTVTASAAPADEIHAFIVQAMELIGVAEEEDTFNALPVLLGESLGLVQLGTHIDNQIHAALNAKLTAAVQILDDAFSEILAVEAGEILGVPAVTAQVLLNSVFSPTEIGASVRDVLLTALTPSNIFSDHQLGLVLRRLHKAVLVITRLEITHLELSHLTSKDSESGWLDLRNLPVDGKVDVPAFEPWSRLVRLFQFRSDLLPEQKTHMFELFKNTGQSAPGPGMNPFANQERQDYGKKLFDLIGWDKESIHALVGKFDIGAISHGGGGILKAQYPQHFSDERLPGRIMLALKLMRHIGVRAFDAEGWVTKPQNYNQRTGQITRIKQALKARYGEDWKDAVKKLRDPLRERQRMALVTYLMHNWKIQRPDDLFDHFLIDVEMSPCMMTSRLIQATASVQLFVQRVMMNLEPSLALTDEGAEQWNWMKSYRVWEANRKVFLYPENWIQPELRDDKTPFFKDLENELLQDDITNDSAETALVHYLEKLHEVARLQVCGQYLETEKPPILHVFARTREKPHHYYYRKGILDGIDDVQQAIVDNDQEAAFDSLTPYWTPWEKVDVDIEGDHLIPVVYNRRMYLFWPIFNSEDEAPLTHFTQQVMKVFGAVFSLQVELERLMRRIGLDLVNNAVDISKNFIGAIETTVNSIPLFNPLPSDDTPPDGDDTLQLLDLTFIKDGLNSIIENIEEDSPPSMQEIILAFNDVGALLGSFDDILVKLLPAKRLEIQLSWSEYKTDSWTAKKVSSGVVGFRDVVSALFESIPELPGLGNLGVKRLFTFRGEVADDNQLLIHCNIALPSSDENVNQEGESEYTFTLQEPFEIGHFRLNSCIGNLEAVDTEENIPILDLVSDGFKQMSQLAENALNELQSDRQLNQRGEPVTPDDDPKRPSWLRNFLQTEQIFRPLPQHVQPPYPIVDESEEDVYRILAYHQFESDSLGRLFGFFYQDAFRTFFCFPWKLPEGNLGQPSLKRNPFGYIFFPFYHPYTCALLENIQRAGIPGIYKERYQLIDNRPRPVSAGEAGLPLQLALQDEDFMQREYDNSGNVYNPPNGDHALRPIEEITFSAISAYAQYNWEVFFHIPLLIASRLSTNQKFREAQHWFHYIFDPTETSRGSVPEKYWRTRPFVEASSDDYTRQEIDELMQLLNAESEVPHLQEIERAVRKWRRDAFNPHLVARTRTVSFQKTVVMKYIDNLIAWGDQLFRRETREAVNEAIQLYVLAAKLLGPRPRRIPKMVNRKEYSYNQLKPKLDAFSNALVDFENYLPAERTALSAGRVSKNSLFGGDRGMMDKATLAPVGDAWRGLLKSPTMQMIAQRPDNAKDIYFCVPPNEILLEKWDLVADRLFKVRHCLNIEGRKLELPLLSPPIDPAILDRAKAAGVHIDEVLGHLQTPLPNYRFQVMAQKATELCNEVKSLGSSLLSALEKRDGEELAQLRNTQELRLLEAVKRIKAQQIDELELNLAGLAHSQEATTLRRDYNQNLLSEFLSPEEVAHGTLLSLSLLLQAYQTGIKWGAVPASLIPNIKGGFVTTLGITSGGNNIGDATSRASDAIGTLASTLGSAGSLISTMGSYQRRAKDWQFQIDIANKELDGLEKQIAAAEIRLEIAQSELNNHQLQIENSIETNAFMQQKFTSKDLYDWMVGQTSTLFFQSYQLAYDLARKVERTYTFELGVDSPGVIQPTHWDSLKKGLLAGDHLHHDLKRLEVAYLEHNIREHELTKHISLLSIDPMQLIELRETGKAAFCLPEALFDLDFPGHFFRRIKSVSITIPSVTGPYSGISATLALVSSRIRCKADFTGEYNSDDESLFLVNRTATRAVATSTGQNDSGLFELNFRDERYLPFEREGVESEWELTMNKEFAQFDFDTISDVVLHVKYTAREGGEEFREKVKQALRNIKDAFTTLDGESQPLTRLFSVRHEFPSEWAKFRAQELDQNQRFELTLGLRTEHYPFWAHGSLNHVKDIGLWVRSTQSAVHVSDRLDKNDTSTKSDILNQDSNLGNLFVGKLTNVGLPARPHETISLYFDSNEISDMWIAIAWGA